MTRTLVAFLLGALTVTAGVFFADGRSSFVFVIGAAAVLIAQAALLGSAKATRRAGETLIRIADAMHGRRRPELVTATSSNSQGAAQSPHANPTISNNTVVEDVTNALVAFGARRDRALAAAHEASKETQRFEDVFRRAALLARDPAPARKASA